MLTVDPWMRYSDMCGRHSIAGRHGRDGSVSG
jgi:hypothetical protein